MFVFIAISITTIHHRYHRHSFYRQALLLRFFYEHANDPNVLIWHLNEAPPDIGIIVISLE